MAKKKLKCTKVGMAFNDWFHITQSVDEFKEILARDTKFVDVQVIHRDVYRKIHTRTESIAVDFVRRFYQDEIDLDHY
ncbi:hypothetical protein KMW28_27140 [Flammeovirga yaeyamensis]|uniref:Uncharacterized protein n=1 Tax=Flammeovirga yaeyamensis TaxID=367791 RepID=A0AAX1NAM2_9BACT|nr:hypothetical protein [Flammeovirga yaeyamensis]MBB3700044.1 hypothetical protein [Flammeovirga yaeyamensis]NMF37519.1 hypothetical protein [Flammeovirga yaeyamensis]QWG04576.1 hypothetical protein KMW28_27140 [Flammeovirga yaeyamensis]